MLWALSFLQEVWEDKFKTENEIKEIIEGLGEKNIRTSHLLSLIDFPERWTNSRFTSQSIIKFYMFRRIKGFNNYHTTAEYLHKHEDEAFQLGFYKDEQNRLLFPPKRTYNYYVSQLDREKMDLLAKRILMIATKCGVVLDLEIVRKSLRERRQKHDQEIKEAVRLVKKLVYPNIDLKLHHNAKFKNKDFLDVLTHVASQGDFTNNGAATFRELNQGMETPSGDLMLHHFSKFQSMEELQQVFDRILDVVFGFARRNYNLLRNRKLDIAYDVHKVPYYGKNSNFICGGKYERGTSKFFQFLTCSIVEDGKRFILDVVPVLPMDDLAKSMDKSLEKIKNKIRIDKVLCDRGFNRMSVIRVMKKHGLHFLMPMVRNPRVKAAFDNALNCKARVFDFKIKSEKVNLVLVDDELGIKRAFICNFDIHPAIAYRLYEMYSKRWGIETGYRNLEKDFKPRTTTRNYHIRLFYFLFACCLYNLWVIVNICVGLAAYGRVKEKPIVTAKMLVILLYKVKMDYFDDT